MKLRPMASTLALAAAMAAPQANAWSLEEAAKPYAGTEVNVVFLDRPGYNAIKAMLPEFEAATGIKMNITTMPYENALGEQVRDFVAGGDLDLALIDLVWIGNFAENGWIVPIEEFTSNADLADPDLDIDDFFPLVLNAFGAWDGVTYGLPLDNYSGLMFYNRCMLEEAGFDGPPETWADLKDVYGPALTKDGKHAFALQSKRNETQSADSFARMLWPFGGSFLNAEFRSNLNSPESQAGLQFRQDLMQYMPDGIVAYDHAETVNALAQGDVAMITEWSAFYSTLASPETSTLGDCLAIAPEPKGPAGRKPALGGFSLAVATQADEAERAAGWLFIQFMTNQCRNLPAAGGCARAAVGLPDPRHRRRVPLRERAGGKLAGGRAGVPPALCRMADDHRDCAGMGHQDDAGRSQHRAGRAGDRHPHGSGAGGSGLLLGRKAPGAVTV